MIAGRSFLGARGRWACGHALSPWHRFLLGVVAAALAFAIGALMR